MDDGHEGAREPPAEEPEGLELAAQRVEAGAADGASRFGWAGRLAKRLARRLMRFHLVRQSEYNRGVVDALGLLEARLRAAEAVLGDVVARTSGPEPRLLETVRDFQVRTESRLDRGEGRLGRIESDLRRHGDHMGIVSTTVEQLQAGAGELLASLRAQGRQLDDVAGRVGDLGELGRELRATSAGLERETTRIQRRADVSRERLARLREQHAEDVERVSAAVEDLRRRLQPGISFDQFDFMRHYRGSEDDIRERMRAHAERFERVDRVLDVGCGRGEFLEVCRERGIGAYGVDLDPDVISRCRSKNLEVVQADAIEHLRGLPDRSLDGILMSEMIEHLTVPEIVELIALAADKLRRGALFVIETINPDTFSALRYFYMDPTHRQPLSSETVKFLLDAAGFAIKEVVFTSPPPREERLRPLEPVKGKKSALPRDLVERYNDNVEKLNALLFGLQDYTVIAER